MEKVKVRRTGKTRGGGIYEGAKVASKYRGLKGSLEHPGVCRTEHYC